MENCGTRIARIVNNPAQPDTAILHSPFYIFNFLLYADIGAVMRLIEVNFLHIGISLTGWLRQGSVR